MLTLRLALAILTTTAPAWSWGTAGHHIVALIAEPRLSPQVREKISKLLMDGKYSLVDISTCADLLRDTRPGQARPGDEMCRTLAGQVPPANALWHYIDIPVPTKSKTLDPFCPEGNCVTARIKSFSEILRTSGDDAQKRQALLFLVHFLGDIHQPLHSAERACDRGGNSERVNFLMNGDKRPNLTLHSVWDSQEVELLMKDSKITDERVYAAALISSIHPGKAKKWARASADQIAWESYKLAIKNAYTGIPYQDFCNNQKPPPIVTDLTPHYEENGTKIVREQLMKAGVRLAAILEEDLGAH
jgi:hypothetical protein